MAPAGWAVALIQGEELRARVRRAVLAVPHRAAVDEPEPETAFVDCADTIREAFGLGGGGTPGGGSALRTPPPYHRSSKSGYCSGGSPCTRRMRGFWSRAPGWAPRATTDTEKQWLSPKSKMYQNFWPVCR